MRNIYFSSLTFVLCYYMNECAQPYFPRQIVFSPDNDVTLYAIDEINQRAYITYKFTPSLTQKAYALKHIPYAAPDSPQSKYYVQLSSIAPNNSCMFGTYWKYGGNMLNFFPSHWLTDKLFEIKNYMNFNYQMIHSNDSFPDEDHWYSNETCSLATSDTYPCQEIYFQKNTDIPHRSVEVRREQWRFVRETTYFTIKSIGKPDDKYFDTIPKNWLEICRDDDLEVFYDPQTIRLRLHESIKIQVWLASPPHRINGNDTVTIHWKSTNYTNSFTISPKELFFSAENFHIKQILTITRTNNTEQTMILPYFYGGGFNLVEPDDYPINILSY